MIFLFPLAAAFEPIPGTVIGGYGQAVATWQRSGAEGPFSGQVDLQRVVLSTASDFSRFGAPISAYLELEWEHAIACKGCDGSVEAEQAYLQWRFREEFQLKAGLILVPMGIVNQWHEPTVIHGVQRPMVDQLLIPTTWRELGLGFTGQIGILHYDIYAVSPLDPVKFSADGVVAARTLGSFSPAEVPAVTGRLEVEPTPGIVAGVSGYGADLGPVGEWYSAGGERLRLSLPAVSGALDVRARRWGGEFRAVGVLWSMPEADVLMAARREDGSPYFPEGSAALPTRMIGGYVELAWDLFYFFDLGSHQLMPFARLEAYNTQAAVPEGMEADPTRNIQEGSFGLSYKPIPNVVFKTDIQLRDRQFGDDTLLIHAGLGWMF